MSHLKNESGQGLTEYLILLVLVAVTSIGITQALGKAVKKKIGDAKKAINQIDVPFQD